MRDLLRTALRSVLPNSPGIAVIHSSFALLGPPAGFQRWDALFVLRDLLDSGWTLALPAFTFSFCGGKSYHYDASPSEVGALADWLLAAEPTALRTPHPIYSFAVAGPQAERIAACVSTTTFGDDSPFALFEREGATIVMLGCGWKYCTLFHRSEEIARVPYRLFKDFTGNADFGKGVRETVARMYVRDLKVDARNDFSPAVEKLRREGAIASTALWDGNIEATNASSLVRACGEILSKDPWSFVEEQKLAIYKFANAVSSLQQAPLRIAVLGSANVHRLAEAFMSHMNYLLPGRTIEIFEAPYGQLRQEILSSESDLLRFEPNLSVFCDRLEDLSGSATLDGADQDSIIALVDQYCDLIDRHIQRAGGWSVIHRFAALQRSVAARGDREIAQLFERANALLDDRLSHLPQIVFLDIAAEAASARGPGLDGRLWYIGRFPFSEEMTRALALRWAGVALSASGKTARLVVLDLDNTLWGGVLGEDGLSGLAIGGDYPGNAFLAFQRALKGLGERGIALAIASKNDEDLALAAMATLPSMQIRPDDIVAHRINWSPKAENIRSIAEELNLGLENVLFIDDNPVEREKVRRELPGVKILDLPDDPTGYLEALSSSPWLAVSAIMAEDRKRAASYKVRREITRAREGAGSLEDFYASLEMKLHLQPLNDGNMARAAQLCQKTNQFNTTTYRYDQRDLRRFVEEGRDVIVLGLQDKFSELENIGLLILKNDQAAPFSNGVVDIYLLSCRVLGRGLETAVLDWAVGRAHARGWARLTGLIAETERNTPVRSVFRDAGFEQGGEGSTWVRNTRDAPRPPPWLTLIDGFSHS